MSTNRTRGLPSPGLPKADVHNPREQAGSPTDPEQYLTDHPPGPKTDWIRVLGSILKLHNDKHAKKRKVVSFKTKEDRHRFLVGFFREIRKETPYRNLDPRQLSGRHVTCMVGRWQERGVSTGAMHNYLSFLRTFAGWLGKYGMVREPKFYFGKHSPHARRSQVATVDKSWTAMEVDIGATIAQVASFDQWVGLQLELCATFALRPKEARHFRPHEAVIPREAANPRDAETFPEQETFVRVAHGTKGGRARDIPLATPHQAELIERLRGLVEPGQFVGNPAHSAKQSHHRFYYVVRKFGITKKELGVVAHGLRHQRVNDQFENDAGGPSPVRGAKDRSDQDDEARERASRLLGHNRLQITNCYLGSGARLPKRATSQSEQHEGAQA